MSIGDRIKEIRKNNDGISMEKFGERIGVGKSTVSNWENGTNVPNNMIVSICREFNVNEDWLRTGSGELTIKLTRNQEISKFLNDVMVLPDKDIKKRLIDALSKLNEEDWETIEKIAEGLRGE